MASLGESRVRSLGGQCVRPLVKKEELLLDRSCKRSSYEGCWAHRAVKTHGLPDGAVWE